MHKSGNVAGLKDGLYENTLETNLSMLVIHYSAMATTDDFKVWLSNNLMQVDYVLATPTYTPITDQGLISALDELEELILNKGYNHITVTAINGVRAYLDLTYYKDINLVLNNLNAQIASVGGAS